MDLSTVGIKTATAGIDVLRVEEILKNQWLLVGLRYYIR